MKLHTVQDFHKTKTGYLVFGLVELGLSYWLFSLAVNSGSLWEWTLTVILFIGFAQNFVKLIGTFISGNKARRA